jgi:hypothetical protein
VPSTIWPTWKSGQFLHIEVGRVIEGTGTLPNNNAENRLPAIYWYYGGADTI